MPFSQIKWIRKETSVRRTTQNAGPIFDTVSTNFLERLAHERPEVTLISQQQATSKLTAACLVCLSSISLRLSFIYDGK